MPHSNILLPSWHLEDVSRDLNEKDAAAVLNGYGLVLHPWVLAACHAVPRWTAAPSPGEIERDRILILPDPSRAKLPAGWLAQAEEQGVIVLQATADRAETLQKLHANPRLRELLGQQPGTHTEDLALLLETPPCEEETFMALGTVYLLTLLLSQAMYHYDNIDETRFTDFLLEAARASLRQDRDRVNEMLRLTCEQLLESREKFYPVDAHLIDMCLLSEGTTTQEIPLLVESDHVVNVFCTGEFLENLSASQPEILAGLRTAFEQETLSLLGSEWGDAATPLLPIQTARWQLREGMASYARHLGVTPAVWMRMRFGLSTQLPLLLHKFGLSGAYHLVLDDGVYPDEEQSHFCWEGRSGVVIQAISRIPLSIENATSLLRIPERMAEAMNHDHLACVVLARWPKLRNPWFQDVVRIQKIVPVLGRFSRLDHFLKETEDSGQHTNHEQRQYLSPYLDQLTGRKQPDAISRFVRYWEVQQREETLSWLRTTTQLLGGKIDGGSNLPDDLPRLSDTLPEEGLRELGQAVEQQLELASRNFAEIVSRGGAEKGGYLILNPLSHARLAVIEFSHREVQGKKLMPRPCEAVKHLQLNSESSLAVVELPACGFVALEQMPVEQYRAARIKAPMAGEWFLQNEFFHVQIDPESGGIQRLRVHGSTENLLSQRLVFRLDGSGGTVPRNAPTWGQGTAEPSYTKMVADTIQLTRAGSAQGRIQVHGRLLSPDQQRTVAKFKQTFTATRGVRTLGVEVEISPQTLPTHLADRSYYAMRFAWAASAAKVRGTLQQSQFMAGERRIESTGPIEIDDGDHRVTLVPHFLPFHQRTAHRMLDSLLIVQGESSRRFRYEIAVDSPHSCLTAANNSVPPLVVPMAVLPRKQSGWFFHLSAPNVQLLHVEFERSVPEDTPSGSEPPGESCRFDFIETEGKHAVVKFATFRTPRRAWEVDFQGKVLADLSIVGDQIQFESLPCDYMSIRVQF